jgi:hypothetical protein
VSTPHMWCTKMLSAIMRKLTIFLIYQLIPVILLAQEYPSVDTVNYGSDVSRVNQYFHYDDDAEKLINSFWFNNEGKHEFTLFGYGYEKQTKISFEYDNDGVLIKVIKASYQSSKNDSLSKAYYHELNKAFEIDISEDGKWDKMHSKYDYINPETVNWQPVKQIPKLTFSRDILRRDSIIEVYGTFHSGEPYLAEKVYYHYNKDNELTTKKWINIEHPNIIEFNAFYPGTAVFEDYIKLISGSDQAKTYAISKDFIKKNYYINGKFTGYGHQTLSNNGLVSDELVFDKKGDTLSHIINTYNTNKLLESRNIKHHSGYSGFGYSMDLLWGNSDKYTYDTLNRLIRIDGFEDEKHVSITRFEIFEK